ncbi:MAG TPA: hypothetical protein VFG63_08215, partial [Nocardioidaceae bacterium]|nr:hypothetical protein [Nocardioidaceae bacterium]
MRFVPHGVAVLVGAAVSVASVAVHRSVVLGFPLGLLLALLTTFATAWAMRDMLPALATSYAAGWLVPFGFVLSGRAEGDYAVASDLRGYGLVLGALV